MKITNSKLKDQFNFHKEFKNWYDQIKKDFKFDYQKDCEARDYLSQIFLKKSQSWKLNEVLNLFKRRLSEKPLILVFGCGPSLEKTVDIICQKKGTVFFDDFIKKRSLCTTNAPFFEILLKLSCCKFRKPFD